MNRLDAGKLWVRKTLERLTRGRSVQMWWWERASSTSWSLFLVGRDETRRATVSFLDRELRAAASDRAVQTEIAQRLVSAIDGLTASDSEPEGPDSSG